MTAAAATTRDKALAKLREPFPPEAIGKLPKLTCKKCSDNRGECSDHKKRRCNTCGNWISPAHVDIDFVGHAALTDRLLDADPEWTWEPMAADERGLPLLDKEGNLWIRLNVAGVTRPGVGDGPTAKERIGDALRNAAMRFGAALDLWHKGELPSAAEGAGIEPDAAQDAAPPQTHTQPPPQAPTPQTPSESPGEHPLLMALSKVPESRKEEAHRFLHAAANGVEWENLPAAKVKALAKQVAAMASEAAA